MDFKQYSKRRAKNQRKEKKDEAQNTDDLKKTFDETVKRSKNMSEKQLMDEILKQAAQDRKEGKLDDADLNKFFDSVAPMLNAEQLKKLKDIMSVLQNNG